MQLFSDIHPLYKSLGANAWTLLQAHHSEHEYEQEVFNLDPDAMIRIVPVYQAFEAIAGIGQNELTYRFAKRPEERYPG